MTVRRPLHGDICFPVGWKFYVNENKLDTINEKIRPEFKTKPEIAAEALKVIVHEIRKTGRKAEVLFDRGYLSVSQRSLKNMALFPTFVVETKEKLEREKIWNFKSDARSWEPSTLG